MTTPDPLAEVARLRQPAGPWLHLLWGAPSDARQFGWFLGCEGLAARVLRGHCVRTAYGLYDEAAAALQFPGDLVEDWAAFGSLLADMSWLPSGGQVLVVTRASLLLAAAPTSDLEAFVSCVVSVATARATEQGPALHVVLADDAVGLAALRARLLAVQAGVRDVVGWRPEEPTVPRGAGGRTGFRAGPSAPDAVDLAVAAALPAEVVELRRGWEEYHGPVVDPVRTYGVVLARAELAVPAAGLVAGVAAGLTDGACVVLPVSAEAEGRGEREAAFVAGSVAVWPAPGLAAGGDGTPAGDVAVSSDSSPAPALPGGQPHIQSAACQDPDEPPDAHLWTKDSAVDGEPDSSAEPATEPTGDTTADTADEPVEVPAPVSAGADSPVPAVDTGPSAAVTGPLVPAADVRPPVPAVDGGESVPAAGQAPADPSSQDPTTPAPDGTDQPRDDPAAPFALVAADLEWEFAEGSTRHDPVDAALVELARTNGLFEAIFRTWTRDPSAGWVRVLVGYAAGPSDPARAALVATAQSAGARRTCVEVVSQPDVGDVHRWLERQCITLWRTETATPARPKPTRTATAAKPPPPALPTSDLDPDTTFRKPPAEEEPGERVERLIAWAAERPGVLGLVVAHTGPDAAPELVYGLVVDGDTDHDPVRAEARAALGEDTARIESFAPSRGLSPLYLRLYRGSTRLWTQRAERPTRQPAGGIDTGPKIDLTFDDIIERTEVEDETLEGGFTLVGLTHTEAVTQQAPTEQDDCDRAVVGWAAEHANLLAAVRGAVTAQNEPTRVYLFAADPDTDVPAVRRKAGAIMAAHELTRGGVEIFCPLDPIPRFHLDLFKHGAQLWRSDRKLTRPDPKTDPDPPAAP
jgi:hypothetical protein